MVVPDDAGYFLQADFGGKPTVAVDAIGGKVYWTRSPSEGTPIDTVMCANLDGSSPEVFHVVSAPQECARYIQVVRGACTVPAISGIGLAIMAIVVLGAGALVLSRRRGLR